MTDKQQEMIEYTTQDIIAYIMEDKGSTKKYLKYIARADRKRECSDFLYVCNILTRRKSGKIKWENKSYVTGKE